MSGAEEQTRALRAARAGVHLIFALLIVVSVLRAWDRGVPVTGAVGAGGLLAALYLSGRWVSARGAGWAAAWFGALGAAWCGALWVSPEFVWVSFPLLLVGGHLFGGVRGTVVGVGIVAVAIGVPWLVRGSVSLAEVLGPVIGGAVAMGMARGYTSVLADAEEHRRLNASLVAAQRETEALQAELARMQRAEGALAERTRIARDIHDTIAQDFSSIGLLARSGEGATGANTGMGANTGTGTGSPRDLALERIATVARRGAEDARRIVRALLPAELESTGLADALGRLVDGFAAETGIAAEWRSEPVRGLGTPADVALLRTLQTALANVRVHAGASRVGVELREVGDTVRLDIVDDGVGFDLSDWQAAQGAAAATSAAPTGADPAGPSSRTGLGAAPGGGASVGLREARARLSDLGGGLDIESAPGDGTALSAWVPVGGAAPEGAGHPPTEAT